MISKLFYAILFLIILLASLAFADENAQVVALDLVFFTLPAMPLFVLTFGAIAIGLILGLLPALIIVPYMRLKIQAMKNRIDMLESNPAQNILSE